MIIMIRIVMNKFAKRSDIDKRLIRLYNEEED